MRIEILYFDGCPNHEPTRRLIQEALASEGLKAELQEIAVESAEEAQAQRFPGSPTVRVNGHDIEPGAENKSDFGLQCRVYRGENNVSGVPPRRLLHAALIEAAFLESRLGGSHGCCERK